MIILVLMSLTLSLALIDIAIKSYVEGYMNKGEERTACKGRIRSGKYIIRDVPYCSRPSGLREGILCHRDDAAYDLSVHYTGQKETLPEKAGLSLMTAGAWSNTFDRWIRGYVIDYVGFKTKWEKITRITYNLGETSSWLRGPCL